MSPRILIVSDVTSPGGVSVYLSQLSQAAQDNGWTATVLLDEDPRADVVEHFLVRQGYPVPRRAHLRRDRLLDQEIAAHFAAVLTNCRPDVVHAVLGSPRSLLVPREVCLEHGIPLVMTEQYIARDLAISADVRARISRIYRRASAVIFVSKENERIARASFGFFATHGIVIPNAVTLQRAADPRRQRGSRKVLCVARLTHQKGVDVLIRAASLLTTRQVKVRVAGDGPLLSELEALVVQHGISKSNFRILGWREDVPFLLTAHDLFVAPSRSEGQPFALLEALSAGLPCIATAVSGIPEALGGGGYGDLVPPDDPNALAAAIDRFFQNPDRLWTKTNAASRHLRRYFDLANNTKSVMSIWKGRIISQAPHKQYD
jgi:glycosyltransferase involved in cell wall biosynthesis